MYIGVGARYGFLRLELFFRGGLPLWVPLTGGKNLGVLIVGGFFGSNGGISAYIRKRCAGQIGLGVPYGLPRLKLFFCGGLPLCAVDWRGKKTYNCLSLTYCRVRRMH